MFGRKRTNPEILLAHNPWIWAILPSFRRDTPICGTTFETELLSQPLTGADVRWWLKLTHPNGQEVVEVIERDRRFADLVRARLSDQPFYFGGPAFPNWKIDALASCPKDGPTRHKPLTLHFARRDIDIGTACEARWTRL